eukprot:642656-Rhodomonas_salina.1
MPPNLRRRFERPERFANANFRLPGMACKGEWTPVCYTTVYIGSRDPGSEVGVIIEPPPRFPG